MNARLEALARDKEHLLACSVLGRMRLRRQVNGVRESLRWRRFAAAAVVAPATYRAAFGRAVSWIGVDRSARMLRLARRIVTYAKLASSISECARALAKSRDGKADCNARQADSETAGSLDSLYVTPV